RVQLSPAERAEIVVDMAPGTTAMLKSYPPDLDSPLPPSSIGTDATFAVLQLRAAADLAPSPEVPAHLADLPDASAQTAVKTRTFELEGREINGHHMDMDRVDTVVEEGTSEIWEVRSMNPFPHSFHVHDQQFRILSIDGHSPSPELAGRKDTVLLSPQHKYRLLLSFQDYADPSTPYMYHCHLLRHEDQGMMGQFVVVPPGHGMPVSGAGHAHE
ncbi:MAG: multicopper oxidase domain-containing protein, partial [bacterium]|nr:multicopper oxidase domain-containing protein [bacterium]